MNNLYVQYGCGLFAPTGWRNFDASPTLRLQKLPVVGRFMSHGGHERFPSNVEYGDIVVGLPIPAKSCRAIYCSHVLEHLALDDFRVALKNTYSYLEEGGIFRFVLPDLEQLAKEYLASGEPTAALEFMEHSYLGRKIRPRKLKGFVFEWLGNSTHLWMWDFESISVELEKAGFQRIRRAEFGDSSVSHFKEAEDIGRWQNCLGVECMR
jgi:SAM-dependent methyltransferase